jgi:hypothetical protein
MAANLHPLAPHDLPSFIPAADGSDGLMTFMAVFLLVIALVGGVAYLNLHSLPERRLHGAGKAQFEIVAILGLLSLFTHNHLFWIAALILAFLDIPDFGSPLRSMAESLDRMSRGDTRTPGVAATEPDGAIITAPTTDRPGHSTEGEHGNA